MNWKKFLLVGVGWGLGTAVGLAAIIGCFIWYSRPRQPEPPKPWNASAIKAEYDHVATEGKQNHIAFFYILENTTDFDYRVDREQNVTMTARVEKQDGFTPFLSPKLIDYPIFVPAKKRVRFVLHMEGYTFPTKEKDDATSEERKQYRANLEKYVADQLPNLDGFDLRDGESRFEIVFPAGWKKSKN